MSQRYMLSLLAGLGGRDSSWINIPGAGRRRALFGYSGATSRGFEWQRTIASNSGRDRCKEADTVLSCALRWFFGSSEMLVPRTAGKHCWFIQKNLHLRFILAVVCPSAQQKSGTFTSGLLHVALSGTLTKALMEDLRSVCLSGFQNIVAHAAWPAIAGPLTLPATDSSSAPTSYGGRHPVA